MHLFHVREYTLKKKKKNLLCWVINKNNGMPKSHAAILHILAGSIATLSQCSCKRFTIHVRGSRSSSIDFFFLWCNVREVWAWMTMWTAVSRISFTTMAAVASQPTKTGVVKQLPAGRRVSPHTKWMETGPAAIVVNEMASHAKNSRDVNGGEKKKVGVNCWPFVWSSCQFCLCWCKVREFAWEWFRQAVRASFPVLFSQQFVGVVLLCLDESANYMHR